MAARPNSLAAKDIAYAVHPYTDLAAHENSGPLVMTRGDGIYVYDEHGKRYIEGLSGLWCTSLGFSEKRLRDAAFKQMDELPFCHSFASRASVPFIELSEKLVSIAPEPLARVFFTNSGSEAVDTAIKMVWYYNNALGRPRKKKIISRRRAYHGITIAAASLTHLPMVHQDFDLPAIPGVLHTDTPCHYRYAEADESEEDFATRLAGNLDALIRAEGADTVAAFIAEPVMGAGGVMTPPATYFDKVQAVLREHDVLMIADEVICGFCRTGNMWGCETYAIRPDMLTCAKALSSAYLPVAAVLLREEIYQAFVEESRKIGVFGHGFTYSGHPVPAAVALETLKIYEERDLVGHVRELAPRFQARLHALAEHPLVGDARGVGLIGGLELVADKATRRSFAGHVRANARVVQKCSAHGLLTRTLPSDTIGVCPPLIISAEQVEDLFDRLQRALDDAERELDPLRAA